jgi:anti-sigma regulatory factor (Ser/Thr protein kinase)
MRPGGFGIMLVKQIADELIYNEAGNEVMLVKYLGRETA